MGDLATTYHQQGRSKEAEEIKVNVLQLRKEVLGERHSRHDLNYVVKYHLRFRGIRARKPAGHKAKTIQYRVVWGEYPNKYQGRGKCRAVNFLSVWNIRDCGYLMRRG